MRIAVFGSVLALVALAAPPVLAATVAVAPMRGGSGEVVRRQIEDGLGQGGLVVVSYSALAAAASKQGFSPADLARPAVLLPVARSAGADAVLQGALVQQGRDESLEVRVFNLDGVELWSKTLRLTRGRLAGDLPRRIARAVSAAIAAQGSSAGQPGKAQGEEAWGQGESAHDGQSAQQGSTPSDKNSAANPEQGSEDDSQTPVKPAPAGESPRAARDRSDSEGVIEAPPTEDSGASAPAPPIVDAGLGFTMTWRSYRVCPGVNSCDQPPPEGSGTAVNYATQSPYGGFSFQGELFPVPRLIPLTDALTLTFGVGGEFSRSLLLTSKYQDPTTQAPGSFSSAEQRLEANALGRLYYGLLGGVGHAGLFGGYAGRLFAVDDNPVLSESRRSLGFALGGDAEVPLAADFLKVNARLAFIPSANPGVHETTWYGQTGRGGGFDLRGGFSGGYAYVGYTVLFAYTRFQDAYDGAGERTANGAVAVESYEALYFMLHGRY